MLTARSGPAVALIGLVALLTGLGATVGLGWFGWGVGLTCGVVVNAAVARGLARSGADLLGAANSVTLIRAMLACGVAAMTADSFVRQSSAALLVAVSVVALVLDAVDGQLARRTRTESRFGARFDGEADAFLILVLSVHLTEAFGGWVLVIGAARYVFAVAGWALPWLREQLPPRYWRKVVAATTGIVLTVAAAGVLSRSWTYAALVVAFVLLAESFGRDVLWLWRRRSGQLTKFTGPAVPGVLADPASAVELDAPDVSVELAGGRRQPRAVAAVVTNTLAVVLVWFALVAPNRTFALTPAALLRIPIEAVAVAVLALVLPSPARRIMAGMVGLVLGLLTLVKVLDLGFFAAFDRPFSLVTDRGYLGSAVGLVEDSIGAAGATLAVVSAVVVIAGVLVSMPLAVGRLTKLVACHRGWSVRAVTGLVVVWLVCASSGLQLGPGEPIASTSASRLAVGQVLAINAGVRDVEQFDSAAAVDHYRDTGQRDLLADLRGKDVILAFVESYGRTAIAGPRSSPRVRAVLDAGFNRLRASGYLARSAFLTSPTFGGLSWLAHSTLQSGLWVDNQLRYERLLAGDRMTLSRAFGGKGWRTVAVMPSDEEPWPEGEAFYQLDKVYDRWDLEYDGPVFGFSSMPDQYALSVFQRLELARGDRTPVMAEIGLASSHAPWAPLPRMVDWDRLGDGSVFDRIRARAPSAAELWQHRENVDEAYARSIAYCLRTLISFVEEYGDEDLVLVLLGDHQPARVVTGPGASHDVPITIIARDPAVIGQISNWGWQEGLKPDSQAPVWPMDAFRDRFLAAYSPKLPPVLARPATQPQR